MRVIYIAYAAIALIIVGLIFLTPQKHVSHHQTNDIQPLLTMNNITLQERTSDNHYHIAINAQRCHVTSLSNGINASKMTCTVFSDNQQIAWLHAHNVHLDRESKCALLNDNVNGNFHDIDFISQHLHYNFAHHIITCPQATKYTHKHFVVQAQQSSIDIEKNCVKFSGGVESELYLNTPTANNGRN